MKKKNSIPIIQKICAIIFLSIIMIAFISLRSQKIENAKQKSAELNSNIESTLKESLEFLYNSDDIKVNANNIIHEDFKDKLTSKFSKANSFLKESNLTLSSIEFNKDRIYNTQRKKIKYLIYKGTVELKWTSLSSNIETDSEKKDITGYIIQEGDVFYVSDIELTNINK